MKKQIKQNILDKCVEGTDINYPNFGSWSKYETQVCGEWVEETAQVIKSYLHKGLGNLVSTKHTHTGSMGTTLMRTDYYVEFSGGELRKVGPSEVSHKSNYAYEKEWVTTGVTVEDWIDIQNEDWSTVNRIVKVVMNYSEWNETERFREVTIYGKEYANKDLLDSFQAATHTNPWILLSHSQPKMVYGSMRMDMEDDYRIKEYQKQAWDDHYAERSLVKDLMKFYFGPEKAKELENFIN